MKFPHFLETYRALIATPSISANDSTQDQSNHQLISLLADWFSHLGFTVEVQPVPNTRHKFNLLATLGSGPGGLLLAGHTDTVPFDDGRWSKDPFTLTEENGRLYGLGTADMKGFFAFILEAVRELDRSALQRPLRVLATADEETSMAGAQLFAATTQIRPDYAVIGEPTSLRPIRAHKGHLSNAIRITGQSGHSSAPDRGVNAIELMHEVIACLLPLRDRLRERFQHPLFTIPYPTMNLGHIHGGDAANRICGCCELHMDIRPLPGLSLGELDALLLEALQPVQARWPGRLSISALHDPIPGYECPPDAEIVRSVERLLGEPCDSVNYCTEAPFIQQVCPTLVLGPGSIEQAHQPDEYLSTDFILPTKTLLTRLITEFCISAGPKVEDGVI
ncbi:acetylornithine deacetylase [Plesiomonas shigelloides]|uniref:acetylornithine deacetylase n=1 Tax=Plesiomonas shigelloides TaxID=703 RepID=UPI0021172E34|nr:acetylornithine deacetylase [Plesiomonas shigelloides]MCQ8859084.1 acetylornithine deacetylase [Plesiomonas shigelloides]